MREQFHQLVGALAWVVLVALWAMLVAEGRVSAPSIAYSVGYIAVVSGAVLAVTAWWIRHNVGIYRRKGPRQGRVSVPPSTEEDRLGRPVRWELDGGSEAARASGHLIVELHGPVKVYRAEP